MIYPEKLKVGMEIVCQLAHRNLGGVTEILWSWVITWSIYQKSPELYTYNGKILWYVNYTSVELQKEKKRKKLHL